MTADLVQRWHLDLLALGLAVGVVATFVRVPRLGPVGASVLVTGALVGARADAGVAAVVTMALACASHVVAGQARRFGLRVLAVAALVPALVPGGLSVWVGFVVAGLALAVAADVPAEQTAGLSGAALTVGACIALWACVPDTEHVILTGAALGAPLVAGARWRRPTTTPWAAVFLLVLWSSALGSAGRPGPIAVQWVVAAGLLGWAVSGSHHWRPGTAPVLGLAVIATVTTWVVMARTVGIGDGTTADRSWSAALGAVLLAGWWAIGRAMAERPGQEDATVTT